LGGKLASILNRSIDQRQAEPRPHPLRRRPGTALLGIAVGASPTVASCPRLALGLDVESDRPRPRSGALARRRLSPMTAAALAGAEDGNGDTYSSSLFPATWTCVEALVKAAGRGGAAPPGLAGFDVLWGKHTEKNPSSSPSRLRTVRIRAISNAANGPGGADCNHRHALALTRPDSEHVAAVVARWGPLDPAPLPPADGEGDATPPPPLRRIRCLPGIWWGGLHDDTEIWAASGTPTVPPQD